MTVKTITSQLAGARFVFGHEQLEATFFIGIKHGLAPQGAVEFGIK